MTNTKPSGVIAAIATPISGFEPDLDRLPMLAKYLLDNGCDGLNVLGTTGEATSFSTQQRLTVMNRLATDGIEMHRMMVGTGTAALAETIELTAAAGELGFGGALVLPPFYYKGVSEDGLMQYFDRLVAETQVPLYLYNFPAQSGIKYEIALIERLVAEFGTRIAGLKDSSGDMDYVRTLASSLPGFDVFPANEGALGEVRSNGMAGCISATANLTSPWCNQALKDGDATALETAVAIRALFDGKPLVPGIKAILSKIHGDAGLADTLPPLARWSDAMTTETFQAYQALAA